MSIPLARTPPTPLSAATADAVYRDDLLGQPATAERRNGAAVGVALAEGPRAARGRGRRCHPTRAVLPDADVARQATRRRGPRAPVPRAQLLAVGLSAPAIVDSTHAPATPAWSELVRLLRVQRAVQSYGPTPRGQLPPLKRGTREAAGRSPSCRRYGRQPRGSSPATDRVRRARSHAV